MVEMEKARAAVIAGKDFSTVILESTLGWRCEVRVGTPDGLSGSDALPKLCELVYHLCEWRGAYLAGVYLESEGETE